MATKLTVELTPPRASNALSSLSPRSFLLAPEMLAPLKQKTTLKLRAEDQKKFRLDPQSRPEERTISQYHARVSRDLPLDRENIHATLPIINTLSKMQETISSLGDKISSQDDKISSQDDRISSQNAMILSMQMEKLNLYIGNILVDFIEKIHQKQGQSLPTGAGNDPSHSTTRHAQAAQYIKKKTLKDLEIDEKYHKALQRFPKYNAARNAQAHDTHIAFAKLLLSPNFQEARPDDYPYWSGLFPFCYDKSVEEVAELDDDDEMNWIRES